MVFVQQVKDHALQNYEDDGWDFVVECYSDAEIAEIIKDCSSEQEAIEAMKEEVRPQHIYRQEVRAEAF